MSEGRPSVAESRPGRVPAGDADLTALARTAAARLAPATRDALGDLLVEMADDEFVIGFVDSEWTGIAPILEEDVAMSSIAQDELGHARALYELLAGVLDDGRDADGLAYDREPDAYRHARLLDAGRGDWAETIVRRFLYELADGARLATIGDGFVPLADLAAKLRREERYHVMHARAWVRRLADGGADSRLRLVAALDRYRVDAASVLAPVEREDALRAAGVLVAPFSAAQDAWRVELASVLRPLGLDWEPARLDADAARRSRRQHSDAFRRLWADFTSVRRSEVGATW